jgi:hypothetical protein
VCGVDKGDNELITLEVSSTLLNELAFVRLFTHCRSSTSSLRRLTDILAMYLSSAMVLWHTCTCDCVQVCELDLIFNFHKAYYILDEVLLCGEQQETSKKIVLRVIAAQVPVCICRKQQLHFSLCTLRVHVFLDIRFIHQIYLRILFANPQNLAGLNTCTFPLGTNLQVTLCFHSDVAGKVSETFDAVLRALK